jgi:hypothetical protein
MTTVLLTTLLLLISVLVLLVLDFKLAKAFPKENLKQRVASWVALTFLFNFEPLALCLIFYWLGLPVWEYSAIVLLVMIVVVPLLLSRLKKRTTIILLIEYFLYFLVIFGIPSIPPNILLAIVGVMFLPLILKKLKLIEY